MNVSDRASVFHFLQLYGKPVSRSTAQQSLFLVGLSKSNHCLLIDCLCAMIVTQPQISTKVRYHRLLHLDCNDRILLIEDIQIHRDVLQNNHHLREVGTLS